MYVVVAVLVLAGLFFSRDVSGEGFTMSKNFGDKYDSLFRKYGAMYGVDPLVLKTIAANESTVGAAKSVAHGLKYPNDISASVSFDGKSWGLMQVTLSTARQFESAVTEAALNDPDVSVRIAAKYINWVMRSYNNDLEYVVRSYNGGPGWKKTKIGPAATKVYWNKFLINYEKVKADGV